MRKLLLAFAALAAAATLAMPAVASQASTGAAAHPTPPPIPGHVSPAYRGGHIHGVKAGPYPAVHSVVKHLYHGPGSVYQKTLSNLRSGKWKLHMAGNDHYACTLTCGDLASEGGTGDVMHNPQLFVVLWGSFWTNETTYKTELGDEADGFGKCDGAGTTPFPCDESDIAATQYPDSTGALWGMYNGVLGTCNASPCTGTTPLTYTDTSSPPSEATASDYEGEANNFLSDYGITATEDTIVAIVTPQGNCPDQFATNSGCANTLGSSGTCGYHSYSSATGNPTYIAMAYPGDLTTQCYPTGHADELASTIFGHEFNESITDPIAPSGYTYAGNGQTETGDLCADANIAPQTIGNDQGFWLQPYYSNYTADAYSGDGCTHGQQTNLGNGGFGPMTTSGSATQYCFNDPGGSLTTGTGITVATCNVTDAAAGREFFSTGDDGRIRVLGRCLEDPSGGGAGTGVVLAPCSSSNANEVFNFNGFLYGTWEGQYNLATTGLCIETDDVNGDQLLMEPCQTLHYDWYGYQTFSAPADVNP